MSTCRMRHTWHQTRNATNGTLHMRLTRRKTETRTKESTVQLSRPKGAHSSPPRNPPTPTTSPKALLGHPKTSSNPATATPVLALPSTGSAGLKRPVTFPVGLPASYCISQAQKNIHNRDRLFKAKNTTTTSSLKQFLFSVVGAHLFSKGMTCTSVEPNMWVDLRAFSLTACSPPPHRCVVREHTAGSNLPYLGNNAGLHASGYQNYWNKSKGHIHPSLRASSCTSMCVCTDQRCAYCARELLRGCIIYKTPHPNPNKNKHHSSGLAPSFLQRNRAAVQAVSSGSRVCYI